MRHFISLIIFTSSMLSAQDKISDFQWKSRLLILSGATEESVELLGSAGTGLGERNLKVFILSGSGQRRYPASPALAKELGTRLTPPEGDAMVYLIGKDGKTTVRWPLGEFTIGKLFASIDEMPMRKREMRETE